ncbi:MAG: hypothetical protein KC776_28825 [Myxococcales bacterium]|nr:hypothetical protein [Myxococcales bacterium]MCB9580970.1 hypothetical protein [Polyangiaceae bacterium]
MTLRDVEILTARAVVLAREEDRAILVVEDRATGVLSLWPGDYRLPKRMRALATAWPRGGPRKCKRV